jgi:hypothetical protein
MIDLQSFLIFIVRCRWEFLHCKKLHKFFSGFALCDLIMAYEHPRHYYDLLPWDACSKSWRFFMALILLFFFKFYGPGLNKVFNKSLELVMTLL